MIPLRAHPAQAHVKGLDGGRLKIFSHSGELMEVQEDGVHRLPEVGKISVEYIGENRSMICSVRF